MLTVPERMRSTPSCCFACDEKNRGITSISQSLSSHATIQSIVFGHYSLWPIQPCEYFISTWAFINWIYHDSLSLLAADRWTQRYLVIQRGGYFRQDPRVASNHCIYFLGAQTNRQHFVQGLFRLLLWGSELPEKEVSYFILTVFLLICLYLHRNFIVNDCLRVELINMT